MKMKTLEAPVLSAVKDYLSFRGIAWIRINGIGIKIPRYYGFGGNFQMRVCDIKIGETYRLKSTPDYGYVKALEIIKPGTWQMRALAKNEGIKQFSHIVVRCEHTVNKNDSFGFVRYFKPVDIVDLQEAGL